MQISWVGQSTKSSRTHWDALEICKLRCALTNWPTRLSTHRNWWISNQLILPQWFWISWYYLNDGCLLASAAPPRATYRLTLTPELYSGVGALKGGAVPGSTSHHGGAEQGSRSHQGAEPGWHEARPHRGNSPLLPGAPNSDSDLDLKHLLSPVWPLCHTCHAFVTCHRFFRHILSRPQILNA